MRLEIFEDCSDNSDEMNQFLQMITKFYMLKFPEDIKTQSIKELLDKTINIASPALHGGGSENKVVGYPFIDCMPSHFIEESVKNHCLVSALYTLEHSIFQGKSFTVRTLANRVTDMQGPLSLRKASPETMSESFDPINNHGKRVFDVGNRDTIQENALKKRICTMAACMTDSEKRLFFARKEGISGEYDLTHVNLMDYDVLLALLDCRPPKEYSRNVFNVSIHSMYKGKFEKRGNLSRYIQDTDLIFRHFGEMVDADSPEEKADYLLSVYKMERYYNFDITKSVIETIYQNKFSSALLSNKKLCNLIASMAAGLPNVFSRDIFIRRVFDCIMDPNNEFAMERMTANELVGYNPEPLPRHSPEKMISDIWGRLALHFLEYFINWVFPLTEKIFMTLLIKAFALDAKNPETIISCIDQLVEYIGNGTTFKRIIEPDESFKREATTDKSCKQFQFEYELQPKDVERKTSSNSSEKEYKEAHTRSYTKRFDVFYVGDYTKYRWKENQVRQRKYNFVYLHNSGEEDELPDYLENAIVKKKEQLEIDYIRDFIKQNIEKIRNAKEYKEEDKEVLLKYFNCLPEQSNGGTSETTSEEIDDKSFDISMVRGPLYDAGVSSSQSLEEMKDKLRKTIAKRNMARKNRRADQVYIVQARFLNCMFPVEYKDDKYGDYEDIFQYIVLHQKNILVPPRKIDLFSYAHISRIPQISLYLMGTVQEHVRRASKEILGE